MGGCSDKKKFGVKVTVEQELKMTVPDGFQGHRGGTASSGHMAH